MLPSSNTSVLAGGRLGCCDLQEHSPRCYYDFLQEKYALHQLEPTMVPCAYNKTLGPATNNFEHQAQITSVSTFTQECQIFCQVAKTTPVTPGMQAVRGTSRPIAADIGLILLGSVRMGPLIIKGALSPLAAIHYHFYYSIIIIKLL